jgi:hypothetical protein
MYAETLAERPSLTACRAAATCSDGREIANLTVRVIPESYLVRTSLSLPPEHVANAVFSLGRHRWLRRLEDAVTPAAPPSAAHLPVDGDQLERGSPIGGSERPGHFPDTPSASHRPHAVSNFSCLCGLAAPDGRRAVPSWLRHSCRPRPSRRSRRPWPLAAQRPGRHLPATDRRTGQKARPRPAGSRPRSGLSWTVISPVRLPLPTLPVRVPRPSLRSGYCNRGPHLQHSCPPVP